jgi:hypothetical protein
MKNIDKSVIEKFLKQAVTKLSGDWVIIGGSVLPVMGIDYRSTLDIDIAAPKAATQKEILKLMEIAESLGLPPEAINPAGAFFLHRLKDWQKHLVLVKKGKNCRILRPDAFLYVRLKLGRLSDSDLSDSLKMLQHSKADTEGFALIQREVEKELKMEGVEAERREKLEKILQVIKNY